MIDKKELRDGPFTVVIVPRNNIKTNIMTPLSYISLSTLKETNNIKVEKLNKHADIINKNINPNKKKVFEVIDLADIDKTIGEISNIKILDGAEITNSKSKFIQGDIIFGKIRPYLNNVAIVNSYPIKEPYFIGSSEWVRIKPNEYPYYILLVLRSKFTLFQTSVNKGTIRPRFNPSDLPFIDIPIIKDKKMMSLINSTTEKIFNIRKLCNIYMNILFNKYSKLSGVETKKDTLVMRINREKINRRRMDLNYYILNEIKKEIRKKVHENLGNLVTFSNKKIYEKYKQGETFEYITTSDANPKQGEITNWEEKVYQPKTYASNKAPGRAQMLLRKNNILIPYLKLSLESIAWIPQDLENYIASNGFAVFEPKNNDYGFLYLSLRSTITQDQLKLIAAGTIMEDIIKEDLDKILIFEPDDKIKKSLSEITGKLLEIKWQTRKSYTQIMALFEDFCSRFILEKEFQERIEKNSKNINHLQQKVNSFIPKQYKYHQRNLF